MASSVADQLPSGFLRTNSFLRGDSSSTYSSVSHQPLPPGHWVLDVHGNCSKCHHHHGSARVHFNVPTNDNATITHVRCQRCNEKWLAFGCRNQTQLSLLSINSITPDSVAVSVQHSLAEMVRLATAIAAPSHSMVRVTESPPSLSSTRQQSFPAAPLFPTHVGDASRSRPMDAIYSNGSADSTTVQPRTPTQFSTPLSVQPSSSQRYGIRTNRRISNLRENLGLRFPALHRANLSRRLSIMRQPRMSVIHAKHRPVIMNLPDDSTATASLVLEAATQADHSETELAQEHPEQPSDSLSRRSTSSDTAVRFLAALANETTDLGALSQKEKAAWVREKYTEFKNQTARARAQRNTNSVGTSTDVYLVADTRHYVETDLGRGQLQDLLGLGSQHGHLSFRPERASTISISTESSQAEPLLSDTNTVTFRSRSDRASTTSVSPRTSQAETLVSETNTVVFPSSPRFSWNERVRRERSGSPRPPSINVQTLQRLRRSGEIRY